MISATRVRSRSRSPHTNVSFALLNSRRSHFVFDLDSGSLKKDIIYAVTFTLNLNLSHPFVCNLLSPSRMTTTAVDRECIGIRGGLELPTPHKMQGK